VDTDTGVTQGVPFVAAGRLLAERGVYGLVWIDDALTVTASYGRLADFVEVGKPVTSSVPPLIGLEQDVLALRNSLGAVVDIPAVSIIADGKQSPRLNLTVLWSAEELTYLLLISRAVPRSDLQIEFSRQIRVLGTSRSATIRTTRLSHEALDDAVEGDAVVELLASELLDPLDMLGRQIRPQFDRYFALRRFDNKRVFRVFDGGHGRALSVGAGMK
jgi:hypothetical protein